MNAPASAANNPLLVLLDFVASPLLLFGADGHVVFTNQAAKAMRCRPHLLLGSDPQVKALVRDVAAGRTPPSLELRVEALSDDGIARLVCRSAPRPVAGLVPVSVAVAEVDALDASPVAAAEAEQRLSLQQIMELLKAELLPPIQQVTGLLEPSSNPVLAQSVLQSRESVAIGIGFRPSGNHLLMNIHHLGVLSAAALSRHAAAIFRPLVDPKGTGGGDTDALLIGLPLTQRILQLHGGRLRIEQDSADGLQVMLELPTGAPMRNTHHLDMLQAQIYAEDLSKLMARTRRRSPA